MGMMKKMTAMMLSVILLCAACGALAETAALPAYVYTGEDPIEGAIADMLAESGRGEDFLTEPGYVMIPCVIIHRTEMEGDARAKVYCTLWVMNYVLRGEVLETLSGGETAAVVTLEQADGVWKVTALAEAGEGSEYVRDVEHFAGGDKELEQLYFAGEDLGTEGNEAIRNRFIRDYAEANDLAVTAWQDFGWDPVPLQ